MMSLITLIQNSKGSPIILKKILNSAAYKELSLEEQATILLNIAENSMGNTEVLMSILKKLKSHLALSNFVKAPNFFNALISLIKHSNGRSEILMLLIDKYDGISLTSFPMEQIQEFFITIAGNAIGNIEVLQNVRATAMFSQKYHHTQIILPVLIAVINSSNGNVAILKNTLNDLESLMQSRLKPTETDIRETLIILAKSVNTDITLLTKIIDFAHEYLATKEQKDLLIEIVEMTNRDPEVAKIIIEQAQYLSSQYSNEVLQFLDTKNIKTIDEHNEETATNISDPANTLLLSFTSASSGNMPEVEENKAIQRENQDEDLKVEFKRPRYV